LRVLLEPETEHSHQTTHLLGTSDLGAIPGKTSRSRKPVSGEKFNKGIEDPEGQDLQRDNRHGRNISGDVPEGPELVKLNRFLGQKKGPYSLGDVQ
jgi:hypothetical protein